MPQICMTQSNHLGLCIIICCCTVSHACFGNATNTRPALTTLDVTGNAPDSLQQRPRLFFRTLDKYLE